MGKRKSGWRKSRQDFQETQAMYREFLEEYRACWHCGWNYGDRVRDWHLPRLENAHIIGGPGRSHDRRNLVRLCDGCHRLAHGAVIRVEGKVLNTLDLSNMLWLKKALDSRYYDRKYLKKMRGQALPTPRRPRDWR